MSATSETVIPNEAVEAIATVAPTAVEILKLANERYNVHVKNLLYISQQRKALLKPYRKEQRPFRKELNTPENSLKSLSRCRCQRIQSQNSSHANSKRQNRRN